MHAGHPLYLALLSLAIWVHTCLANSGGTFTLVNSEGAIRSTSQLSAYGGDGAERSITAVLDTTGGSSLQLLKACLQMDISLESSNCISMSTSKDKAVLYAVYQQMNGAKYCGSRVAEFCCGVAHRVVIVLPAQDLLDTLRGHEQVLRKLAHQLSSESELTSVVFLVDTTAAPAASIDTVSSDVQTFFINVFADAAGKVV